MTLAERCYDRERAEDELFSTIHKILVGDDLDKALDKGFVWRVIDVWCDPYDESVEVILCKNAKQMTRDEVNQILDLGFGQVWESCGDIGIQWTRTYESKCIPKQSSDESSIEVQKLRAEVKQLKEKLKEAQK